MCSITLCAFENIFDAKMSCVQCVICTELMTDECALVHLKCGHVYHQTCLNRWFNTSKSCPDCRIQQPRPKAQRVYLHFTNHPDVATLHEQRNHLNEQLRQCTVTMDEMTKRIHKLDKAQVDQIIENYQLKKDKNELAARLDQFRIEFVQAKNELQLVKTENERLKYELTVADNEELANMQIENHQLKKDNVDLSGRLDLFREEFLKANNELQQVKSETEQTQNELKNENANLKEQLWNAEQALLAARNECVVKKMLNEEIDAKVLHSQCGDHSSSRTINTMDGNEQSEIHKKMNGLRETMAKRKNDGTADQQCANNSKRQRN